jgi:hypothetical protein
MWKMWRSLNLHPSQFVSVQDHPGVGITFLTKLSRMSPKKWNSTNTSSAPMISGSTHMRKIAIPTEKVLKAQPQLIAVEQIRSHHERGKFKLVAQFMGEQHVYNIKMRNGDQLRVKLQMKISMYGS